MIIDKKQAMFIFSFALVNVAASLGVFFFKEYYRKTHPVIEIKEDPDKKEDSGIVCVANSEGISFLDKFNPGKVSKIAKTMAYKKLMDELEKRDVTITISFLKE